MSRVNSSIPVVEIEAEEQLAVVIPHESLTREERNTIIACLISSLHTTPHEYRTAVELVYNIIQMALPGIRAQTPDIRSMQVRLVSPSRDEMLSWVGLSDTVGRARAPALPDLPGPINPAAQAVTSTPAVYIAVASLLFSIGRQASESASAAALDKRPDALIRRFTIAEEDQLLLPGREAGPARPSLELIYNAFSVYSEVRGEIVRYLIGVQRSADHFPISYEIILTNFNLMRGAGMTHVDAILRLVKMHPWTLKVPQLEPQWAQFAKDLVEFNKVDPDIRPYHRLLVGQASYLFLSPNLAPLIAVAGHFIQQVEKTFANYVYRKEHYTELIEMVDQYAPGYVPTHKVDQLAALLGVTDVDLPKVERDSDGHTPPGSVV